MIAKGLDVVSFLKEQHQQVKSQFETVLKAQGDERKKAFMKLQQMLSVHEAAEEEIVHPAARHVLANGEQIVSQREKEEDEAKRTLSAIAKLDVGSIDFEQKLRTFQTNVLQHAESEEKQEFDKLQSALDQSKLASMTQQVMRVEQEAAGSSANIPFTQKSARPI